MKNIKVVLCVVTAVVVIGFLGFGVWIIFQQLTHMM